MTDRPYTDEDLRIEAARQHYTATTHPDFVGIGEQMDGSRIESTVTDSDASVTTVAGGRTWDMLAPDDFDDAMRAIDKLLSKAADVSDWSVNLGADGLQPDEQRLDIGREPRVRIHFAFAPDMSAADRRDFIAEIAAATITAP